MLSILSLLLGSVSSLVGNLFGYKTNQNNAQAAVEAASIETMGAVEQKWWFVAFTIPLFAAPFELWTLKAVGWDKVIGPMLGFHSTTAALGGDLSKAYWIVLAGIFLHAAVNAI